MNQQALNAKKAAVSEIVEGLKNSQSLTVVSYQGLTVAELQEVRRALAENGNADLGDLLNGPNAFVFSKDLGKGPKVLYKFARTHQNLVVKGGLAEGKVCDADEMKVVSKLPDKNGMISMFLSCLNAPIQKFAATVQAIADKSAGAPAPAAN